MKKTLYQLNPKSKFQTDFYVFDTETKIRKNGDDYWGLRARPDSFVFGVVYGHNYTNVIHSVEDFKNEFKKERYKNKFVFAHNAEYDLNVIFDNIYAFDPEAIFNGKFITATNGNCFFGDSMNIYRFGVAKIGEIIGKRKGDTLKDNIEYDKPIEYPITSEMINYCIRDCEIVYDALLEFFMMCNDIKLTQASLSLTYFRRFHMPMSISYDSRLVKYFFNSYYGGRTEAFKIGEVEACAYDVNSMYPDKMRKITFPNPLKLKRTNHVDLKTFDHILDTYEGCALIDVNHKDTYFGFLPYKFDKKLFFPTGRFKTWVNFNEIRFALKHKVIEILDIQECIYSEPINTPFESFIMELYEKRKNCDNELERTIYKLLMNSLYGKFAQRIDKQSKYLSDIELYMDEIVEAKEKGSFIELQIFNEERLDAFLITKKDKKYDPAYSIPSYSSYITSEARIQLLEKLVELEEYEPVYCDTDSIFFNIDPKINTSKELGEWGKETKIVTEIRGLKNYSYWDWNDKGEKQHFNRIKGVPKNAIEIAPNTYQYTNLIKTKEGLRRNLDSGEPTLREKIISNQYTKRQVFADGTTKPIKL